jgi:hypothetical protein
MDARQPTITERELFVKFCTKLLSEPIRDAIGAVEELERHLIPIESGTNGNGNGEAKPSDPVQLPMEDFIEEVHKILLGRLFDLAQTDMKLSLMFSGVMAYIKRLS